MPAKGISRGRSIVTLEIRDGILLVAENPSTLLHKISEIYDRHRRSRASASTNEFEKSPGSPESATADIQGYSYSRGARDGQGRSPMPTRRRSATSSRKDIKPFEVECWWRRWPRPTAARNEIYHILLRRGPSRDEHNLRGHGRARARRDPPLPQGTNYRDALPLDEGAASLGCARSRSPRNKTAQRARPRGGRAGPQQGAGASSGRIPARGAQPTAGHTEVGTC